MDKNRTFKVAAAAAMLACAGVASAGTASANLAVTASVAANCTIATTAVAFGAYDPIVTNSATPLDATGAVTIACTKGATPTITLGLGANASGSTRQMTGTGGLLAYELYQQPGTTPATACNYTTPTVWGTTGPNIYTPTAAPSKTARSYNVCGRVAAGQDVGTGNYSDTVVATVNF